MAKRKKGITKEKIDKIVKCISLGNYATTAAMYVGISETAFYNWIRRGRNGNPDDPADELYIELYERVNVARAEAEINDIEIITEGAKTDWRAAAWRLARRNAGKWSEESKGDIDQTQADKSSVEAFAKAVSTMAGDWESVWNEAESSKKKEDEE